MTVLVSLPVSMLTWIMIIMSVFMVCLFMIVSIYELNEWYSWQWTTTNLDIVFRSHIYPILLLWLGWLVRSLEFVSKQTWLNYTLLLFQWVSIILGDRGWCMSLNGLNMFWPQLDFIFVQQVWFKKCFSLFEYMLGNNVFCSNHIFLYGNICNNCNCQIMQRGV